jgi:hypothetical protein
LYFARVVLASQIARLRAGRRAAAARIQTIVIG